MSRITGQAAGVGMEFLECMYFFCLRFEKRYILTYDSKAFRCDINEEKFLTAGRKLIDLGLAQAGYNYVNSMYSPALSGPNHCCRRRNPINVNIDAKSTTAGL